MATPPEREGNGDLPWINPVGGLGDTLMVSGVLKLVHDADPTRRFHLIRRTAYLSLLQGHPAIQSIGHPPKGARILGVDYWSMEPLGAGEHRAFQVLARSFGLPTPVEEVLYLPGGIEEDPVLAGFVPWRARNIIIAPASASPRKAMHPTLWHRLVDLLQADGCFVVQVGRRNDVRIRNAYSLLGVTNPRQVIGLLPRASAVVTCDNFLLHAAHLAWIPTVALWGATRHEVYGYPEQVHIQMPRQCGLALDHDCVAPEHSEGGRLYGTPCPLGEAHCLDQMRPETVLEAVRACLLKRASS